MSDEVLALFARSLDAIENEAGFAISTERSVGTPGKPLPMPRVVMPR